jgi:hypothetical protein
MHRNFGANLPQALIAGIEFRWVTVIRLTTPCVNRAIFSSKVFRQIGFYALPFNQVKAFRNV